MKYLLLMVLLTACDSSLEPLFKIARSTEKVCFNIKEPEDLVGRYCIEYMENELDSVR